MKKYDAISIVQVSLLLTTAIGLKNHVTVIPHLLGAAKRDAWISVLVALATIILWCSLLLYIHKATQPHNIFDWLEKQIGKKTKWMLSIPTSIVLMLLAALSTKELVAWTKVTYLPFTPSFFTIFLFVLLCFFLVCTSLQTMSTVNTLVLSIVIVLGFFVAIANIQFKEYSLLRPILEHGFSPVMNGIIYPLSGQIEIISLLFLQQKIYDRLTFKAFFINSMILSFLTIGPLIGAIIVFGPIEAARTRFPAYDQWGLVTIGRFIEHVDFLSIYQWITGAFIRVAFLLLLSIEVLALKDKRKKTGILLFYSVVIITVNLIPISDLTLHQLIGNYSMPINFWYFLGLSILLSLFIFFKNRTKRRDSDVQTKEQTAAQGE